MRWLGWKEKKEHVKFMHKPGALNFEFDHSS